MDRSTWVAPASMADMYCWMDTPAVSWEWKTMFMLGPTSLRALLMVS